MRAICTSLAPFLLALAACSAPGGNNPDGGGGGGGGGHDGGPGSDVMIMPTESIKITVEPANDHADEIMNAIQAATMSVYMTMYQIDNTDITAALVAAKGRGLDVEAILDSSSTCKTWNTPAYNALHSGGVNVVWSNPTFTYTHEKTLIIDATSAWIMTMNLNESPPDSNREYLALDTDAADVTEATAVFKADHAMQTITPSGDLVVADTNARSKLVALIDEATTTLDVEVEEFSDTNQNGVVDAVANAANRGVKVRVVIANDLPLSSSQTQAINLVKNAGGKVVMSGPDSSGGTMSSPYIHAKAIVIDCAGTSCKSGFVGSENFSAGSLGYNRELGVIFSTQTELAKVESAIATDYAAGTAQ